MTNLPKVTQIINGSMFRIQTHAGESICLTQGLPKGKMVDKEWGQVCTVSKELKYNNKTC